MRNRLRWRGISIKGTARWRNPDDDPPRRFQCEWLATLRPLKFNSGYEGRPVGRPGVGIVGRPASRPAEGPRSLAVGVGASVNRHKAGWVDQLVAARHATRAAQHRTVAPSGECVPAGQPPAVRHAEGDRSAPQGSPTSSKPPQRARRSTPPPCGCCASTHTGRTPAFTGRRPRDHGVSPNGTFATSAGDTSPPRERPARAITEVVNATLAARHEHLWGQATTTASDSTKFGAWDHNLLTEWHARTAGRV